MPKKKSRKVLRKPVAQAKPEKKGGGVVSLRLDAGEHAKLEAFRGLMSVRSGLAVKMATAVKHAALMWADYHPPSVDPAPADTVEPCPDPDADLADAPPDEEATP